MTDDKRPPARRRVRAIIGWLILPLILGLFLSTLVPRPVVGLIYLDGPIGPLSAHSLIAQIAYARDHWQVRSVVLVMDSPGGTAVDTESVYMELARLRQTKPVVTLVEGMTASGAYYLAAGTDYIIAKPSSEVGSIGVLNLLPPQPSVVEDLVTTGPYKAWGAPPDAVMRELETVKQGFFQAVKLGRGAALRVEPIMLLRGEIWLGTDALRMGLVDELGAQSRAVEKAAQLGRIPQYRVTDLREMAGLPVVREDSFFIQSPDGAATSYPREPGLYLLYVPPAERRLP
jgi:protease-4